MHSKSPMTETAFRPQLSRWQARLVSAITKSFALKRVVALGTPALPIGAELLVGSRRVRLDTELGSGLVGRVYAASCARTGSSFALKRPRARLAFFREALRVERAVAAHMAEAVGHRGLRAAEVIDAGPHALLKELCPGPTLASLMVAGRVGQEERIAVEAALAYAATLYRERRVYLDLSPKNLAIDTTRTGGTLVLLDTGPKIATSDFLAVLDRPSFDTYSAYVARKLAQGQSAPSALQRPETATERLTPPTSWAFVRDFWRWFPLDDELDEATLLIDIVDGLVDSDLLATAPQLGTQRELAYDGLPWLRSLMERAWLGRPELGGPLAKAATPPFLPIEQGWGQPVDFGAAGAIADGPGVASAIRFALGASRQPSARPPRARRYRHWRELATPGMGSPLDIYTHARLDGTSETDLRATIGGERVFQAKLQVPSPGFVELLVADRRRRGRRAYLFVPGFRAGAGAALPLANWIAAGNEGLFALSYIGVDGPTGPAVTTGHWEGPLLIRTIDTLCEQMDCEQVTILAASHGCFGAIVAAEAHPAVDFLVLDSAPRDPDAIVRYFARMQGVSPETVAARQREHRLLTGAFAVPRRPGLRVASFGAYDDPFDAICGTLRAPEHIWYRGRHAALMRHDTWRRGLPLPATDRLQALLRASTANAEANQPQRAKPTAAVLRQAPSLTE